MANNWFFLSYARLDRDDDPYNCIRTFYNDLDREVRRKKVIKQGSAGFFDGTGIQQGDAWPQALGEALARSRILLCMYSPAYFDSEYCGKEWNIFSSRLERAAGVPPPGIKWAPLILPVLLDPPEDLLPFPNAVEDIQYVHDEYPAVYREEGLRYLMRRNNKELKDAYLDFLDALVRRLIQAAELNPLGVLETLPDIKSVSSAFHVHRQTSVAMSLRTESAGPRYAEFIYVAGKREEIKSLGRKYENYGDEGGLDWKPYLPGYAFEDEIALVAQEVATKEGFRYQRLPLESNIVQLLEDAQHNKRIVVLVVDTWALRLQTYRTLMQQYDAVNFWNSAVLIAWNNRDDDTVSNRPMLEAAVRQAFVNKGRTRDPNHFVDSIGSPEDLINFLSIILQKVKMQIIEITKDLNIIESTQVIAKPIISGPGAISD